MFGPAANFPSDFPDLPSRSEDATKSRQPLYTRSTLSEKPLMVATTSQDPQNLFDDLDDAQLCALLTKHGPRPDHKNRAKAGARWDDADLDDASNPNVMRNFYQHLFPWRQLFLWLNSAPLPSRQWTHREFAFTLQNDAYLRYNSFAADVDLKKEVLRLIPSRFEIGPVYSAKMRRSPNPSFFLC